jgi:O-antigen/teichoic acid export membrane protein
MKMPHSYQGWIFGLFSLYDRGAAMLMLGRALQLLNSFGWSVVIVKHFGLNMLGTFAVGMLAVTVLSVISPLGLPSYLPRLNQPHACLCFAGLLLQLSMLLPVASILVIYAKVFAHNPAEERIIFLVALSGSMVGLCNTGLMLSIMVRRFYPAVVAPLFEGAAILVVGLGAASGEGIAAYLLVSRIAGALVIWLGMRCSVLPPRQLTLILRNSATYLAPDAIAMLSEQIAPLILLLIAPRAELGLFRLCQQMLNASDTPGWSYVQSKYPDLVRNDDSFFASVNWHVVRLSLLASALCVFGSAVLGFWVYRLPIVVPMMCILAGSLFWRYKNNLYEQSFRASGQIEVATVLGAAKLLVAALVFSLLIYWGGLWGAVLALAAVSIAAGIGYECAYRRPGLIAWVTQ